LEFFLIGILTKKCKLLKKIQNELSLLKIQNLKLKTPRMGDDRIKSEPEDVSTEIT
jgi:hypothetical protein